jgi:mono/diheme cytochrome c family protein
VRYCFKKLVLFIAPLAFPVLASGQNVTPVRGESWLKHIHRRFDQTSMGKSSGVYGPRAPMPNEWPPSSSSGKGENVTSQNKTLSGVDLYRFKCQGCHGVFGVGAPPEIRSVVDPVRATSAKLYIERMKQVGMDVDLKAATPLAKQARQAIMDRLHKGGTDMPPPDPQLTDPETRSLLAYLRQLAGIPGAEKEQVRINESPLRIGEHVVKNTCHICHDATGPNPTPNEILNGQIPPLSTLASRLTLNDFLTKVVSGRPVLEGPLALPMRGHMPVFTYLNRDEAADVYFYLSAYPPQQ